MNKKTILNAAAIALIAIGGFGQAAGAEEKASAPSKQMQFNIPAGELIAALEKLGERTHLTLVYDRKLVEGKPSVAVNGRMSVEVALKQLLEGTGLGWSFVSDDTVVLKGTASSMVGPAGQMRVADSTSSGSSKSESSADDSDSKDQRNQITVQGERDKRKPFSDRNVDLPRTINDVQPYYVFDANTIDQSGATNIEDFLKQRLTMNAVAETNQGVSGVNTLGNTSGINLRGVGIDKTLILINGRRVAGVNITTTDYQPDLNGIPLGAIDRIEVLPSSASGIYGGSAIGGVVNVILKRDFAGGEVRATYDNTSDGNAPRSSASASYGFSLEDGRSYLSINAAWSEQQSLLLRDRVQIFRDNLAVIQSRSPTFISSSTKPWLGSLPNISSVPKSLYVPVPAGTPGSISGLPIGTFIPGTTSAPNTPENPNFLAQLTQGPLSLKNGVSLGSAMTYVPIGTANSTSATDLAAGLLANAGQWNMDFPLSTQAPTGLLRPIGQTPKTRAIQLGARRQMLPWLEVLVDFSYAQNQSASIYHPINISLTVPATAPTSPFTTNVFVTVPDAGEIPMTTQSQSDGATIGAVVQLPRGWTGMLDYSWSESRFNYSRSSVDTAARDLDLASGVLNPFVDSLRYPLNFARYYYSIAYQGANELRDVALRGAGPLPALPWGQPSLAIGLEDRITRTPERTLKNEYPLTTRNSYVDKYYARESTTRSGYMEATVPLVKENWLTGLKALDLQVSSRVERYQVDTGTAYEEVYRNWTPPATFYGGTTLNGQPYFSKTSYSSHNYTLGLKYQPMNDMTLRISQATAFIPPTPSQLVKDPLPNTNPTFVNDPRTGQTNVAVSTLTGGNPDLTPQNSKSLNVGVIWEPKWKSFEGLRLNAEYYKIEQFDAVGDLSAQAIVSQEANYPGRITRDSGGTITQVDISLVNLYHQETEGWDLSADFSMETSAGRLSLHAVESIILHLKSQYSQTQPEYEAAGYSAVEGGAAKYKTNMTLNWEVGQWTVGWTTRYFGSYKQYGAAGGPFSSRFASGGIYSGSTIAAQGSDSIPAQTYHDIYLSYTPVSSRPQRAFPPLSGISMQLGVRNVFGKVPPLDVFYSAYVSPYGDIRLRSYWLSARKSF